jgi:hypothetical protein
MVGGKLDKPGCNGANRHMALRFKTDVVAGAVLLALAGGFAWLARDLPLGRAVRMGPGWAPMALCLMLASLGAVLVLRGYLARIEAEPSPPWPVRAASPVIGSLLLFGLSVESLGLLLASGLSVFLAMLGASDFKVKEAVAVSTGLALGVSVLFGIGLGLPVKILP